MATLSDTPTPPTPVRERRTARLLRSCWSALATSKLNRAALLALLAGSGLGVYGSVTEGSESLARGGWTTVLTSLSILVAYTAGFLIRRALRLVAVLAASAAGAIAILKVSGVELSLSDVTTFVRDQASQFEVLVRSWLPSGAGGAAGLFFGLRRGRRVD